MHLKLIESKANHNVSEVLGYCTYETTGLTDTRQCIAFSAQCATPIK
jgi:hypothetical protein